MFEKVKVQIQNHKREYIKGCALTIGVCAIAYASYRLGAQRGAALMYAIRGF